MGQANVFCRPKYRCYANLIKDPNISRFASRTLSVEIQFEVGNEPERVRETPDDDVSACPSSLCSRVQTQFHASSRRGKESSGNFREKGKTFPFRNVNARELCVTSHTVRVGIFLARSEGGKALKYPRVYTRTDARDTTRGR